MIILNADDWQACYVDGTCIQQSHKLGEGKGFLLFLKELIYQYNVTLDDIVEKYVNNVDNEILGGLGQFPQELKDLKGDYTS